MVRAISGRRGQSLVRARASACGGAMGPRERTVQTMSTSSGPNDRDAELKARLDKLSGALKAEQAEAADERKASEARTADSGTGKAMATGFRVASELLAGIMVGGFIGWWIDRWLGTSPIALLVMLLLGMVAGFWNVYRIAVRPTGGTGRT